MKLDKLVYLLGIISCCNSEIVKNGQGQKPEENLNTWQLLQKLNTSKQKLNQLLRYVKKIESRENNILERMKHLETREKNILERMEHFGTREKNILERMEHLETREKNIFEQMEHLETQEKDFLGRMEHLESREKDFLGRMEHLESREKNFLGRMEHLESREKDFIGRMEHLVSRKSYMENLETFKNKNLWRIENLEKRDMEIRWGSKLQKVRGKKVNQRLTVSESIRRQSNRKNKFLKWHKQNMPAHGVLENSNKDVDVIPANMSRNIPIVIKDKRQSQNVKQRRRRDQGSVAFFATISHDVYHAGVHQIYVFDNVVTNLGHAYNNHNGNFIAPMDGTYVFSVTLMSMYHKNAHAAFVRNGKPVSAMLVKGDDAGHSITSQTIIVQLHQWDDVSIHNLDADSTMAGSNYSVFSGFLLYEGYPSSQTIGK